MIRLLLLIVVVGVLLYVVENYLPMAPPFKMLLRAVSVIFLILLLLRFFGLWV